MFNNLQIQPIVSQMSDVLHVFLTASVMISLSKINERSTLYIKTQYLILVLLSFGIPLMRVNISNIVPIYILLELGTVLFILLTLKGISNSHLTKFKKNLVMVFTVALILPAPAIVNTSLNVGVNNLWVDLYKTNLSSSEFVFWSLPILKLRQGSLTAIIFLIGLITTIILYIKSITTLGVGNKNKIKLDIFMFIKSSVYFTKKNLISFFKPN